jgi:hypothetical protein
MKSAAISFVIVAGTLGAVTLQLRAADGPAPARPSAAAVIVTNKSTGPASAKAPYLSAGLPEIVKMHKAGVDASVLMAFVQNSPVAYHPSAKEIIYLRDQGLSSEIISALLRRGGELRDRAAEAAREERSRTAPAPAPVAPPAPASPAPPQAAASTPVVVYANSTYPVYTTPTYVSYASYGYGVPAYYGNSYYRPSCYSYRAGCYPYAYGGYRSSWYPSFYAGYRSGCYSGWGFGVGYGGGRYYGHGGGHYYGHGGGYRFAGGWRGGGAYCRR